MKGIEQQSRFTFDKTQSITPRENDSGNLKEKNFLWGVVSLKGSEQLTRPTVAAKKFYDHAEGAFFEGGRVGQKKSLG